MNLDGFPVLLGDLIWDILLGNNGVVTAVGGGSFTVQFGTRSLTYTGNGNVAGVRRAYWRNPILTLPQKADSQWPLLQATVAAVRANPCP